MNEGETRVVNLNDSAYDVYIGRGSTWGNPYKIGEHGSREEVIGKYEAYIMAHPYLIKQLEMLKGKVLGCFCKPLACHGDILVRMIEDEIWLK